MYLGLSSRSAVLCHWRITWIAILFWFIIWYWYNTDRKSDTLSKSHYPWFQFYFQNLDGVWIKYTLINNLIALISIGLLFDKYAFIYPGIIELVRCVTYVYCTHEMNSNNLIDYLTYYAYAFHLIFVWIPYFIYKIYAFV